MYLGFVIVIVLVCCSIFVNGWTDAPNAIATVVSTRVLPPRFAVGMAAVFNLMGVFLSGTAVANTIGKIITLTPGKQALITLAAAQIAIVLWSVTAWKFGIPTSESHGLIAGLTGAGLASARGWGAVSINEWKKVIIGLVVASIVGYIAAYFFTKFIQFLFRKTNRRAANKFFSAGQIFSAACMAYNHGAQDGQKFMGVFALAMMLAGMMPMANNITIPMWMMFLCSGIMALGTSIGGYKIIKTMGMDMVKIEKYQGFSAEIAASACMFAATATGVPLSTTNAKATAIMGAAAARRKSNVNWGIVKEMVLAWVLTFPICTIIGFLMVKLLYLIF